MDATRRESHSAAAAAAVALALAACAGLSFGIGDAVGFLSPSTEGLFTVLWLAGWALVAGAAVVGGTVTVHLIHALASRRRRPALTEAVLAGAAIAAIAIVISVNPLIGSGAGAG